MKYRFQCAECGYAYKSLWYEPNWIAKRFYTADHNSFHYTSWANDYPSQWKRHGAELERERIIKLLEHEIEGFESEINQLNDGDSLSKGFFLEDIRQHKYLIALIKGEK
jgi:hypothetical protein